MSPYLLLTDIHRLNLQVGDACTGIIDGSLSVQDFVLEHFVGVVGLVNLNLAVLLLCLSPPIPDLEQAGAAA